MDIASTLLGFAGGGTGASVITWLLNRRRQGQIDVTDVAERYWARIDLLEQRMTELQTEVAALRAENAMLKLQVGIGIVTP